MCRPSPYAHLTPATEGNMHGAVDRALGAADGPGRTCLQSGTL